MTTTGPGGVPTGVGSLGTVKELPPSSRYVARASEPVTDADRTEINTWLNDAFSAGTLDEQTFQHHLDALYAATTLGDLAPVVADLPARATHNVPQNIEQSTAAPGELTPSRPMSGRTMATLVGGGGLVVVLLIIILAILL